MRFPKDRGPKATRQPIELTAVERRVLVLLARGTSLRSIGQRLRLPDTAVNGHRRALLRKFDALTTDDLISRALSLAGIAWDDDTSPEEITFQHQSRWLPDVKLSHTLALSVACRRALQARTLRDVADALRDCGEEPNPSPDDPNALLVHLTGTLGAKQALLAALAVECGRADVQLILACHELPIADPPGTGTRPATLPMILCHLRSRARNIQIAEAGSGSILYGKALSVEHVDPLTMAAERVTMYQTFASEWCRALDVAPAAFAQLRAEQLRMAARRSVFEDLLGYRLAPGFTPSKR
jgi:DNA-binding CsgD family transcriptional regulator